MKKSFKARLISASHKIGAGAVLASVAGVASADTAAAITAAFAGADTNVGLVVAGVIALAAVATGVGLILKFLTK